MAVQLRRNTQWDVRPDLSRDGKTLYFDAFERVDGFGSHDIWFVERERTSDPFEGPPDNLGPGINTEFDDAAPNISSNGLELYFASARPPGGRGNWDLYVARRDSLNQPFDNPSFLEKLNTGSFESEPKLSADELTLFFFRNTGGNSDIWIATREETTDEFAEPVNLGWPVNAVRFEYGPSVSADWPAAGSTLYFNRCFNGVDCDMYEATWHPDCNGNSVDDLEDIQNETSLDEDRDGQPDECGCPADFEASRTLWDTRAPAEGGETVVFEEGREYEVKIEVAGRAAQDAADCPALQEARVVETVPDGWEVDPAAVLPPGTAQVQGATITWELDLNQHTLPAVLTYTVTMDANGQSDDVVQFEGSVGAPKRPAAQIEGDHVARSPATLASISDFGSIQHWLILGPFTHDCTPPLGGNPCDAPGEAAIVLDYLTDGDVEEVDIEPREGDMIVPDYAGAAASDGLAPNALDRNPQDIPTWIAWRDFDDEDDRIDFESVYGNVNNAMCYAVTYLDVLEDTTVWLGVSSDDSVGVLLDGETIHVNNIPRGAFARQFQDHAGTFSCPGFLEEQRCLGPIDLDEGRHTLLVKVFEGVGGHNFRIGFTDEAGQPLSPEVLEDVRGVVEISLEPDDPPVRFRRGECNGDSDVNLADAVCALGWLFGGGAVPGCLAALNTDGDDTINIADPVSLLSFLFGAGPPPVAPIPDCGPGLLPADAELGCANPPECQ